MNKISFRSLFFVLSVCVVCLSACTNQAATPETTLTNTPHTEDLVKRGEYLVMIMGCNDCHSPKRMGPAGPEIIPELLLSGFPTDREILDFTDPKIKEGFAMFYPDLTAAAGPWGMTFAGNLTPDETGIGNWSEEQFIKALTQGKYKGLDNSRHLLPPMPVENYKDMKKEDVLAIFTYLKSIPAVNNIVPAPIAPAEM